MVAIAGGGGGGHFHFYPSPQFHRIFVWKASLHKYHCMLLLYIHFPQGSIPEYPQIGDASGEYYIKYAV